MSVSEETKARYLNDVTFHAFVHQLVAMVKASTPRELHMEFIKDTREALDIVEVLLSPEEPEPPKPLIVES